MKPFRLRLQFEFLFAVLAVAVLARLFLFDVYVVRDRFHEPEVLIGDQIIVFKLSYGTSFGDWKSEGLRPARDRLYVVDQNQARNLVRIVGTSGDIAACNHGLLTINELETRLACPSATFRPLAIPPESVFVVGPLGDKSDEKWGSVPRKDVIGRAFMVLQSQSLDGTFRWHRIFHFLN